MRFLANENFSLKSVRRLREAGHDVGAVIEDSPGAKDRQVLARAVNEQRIVLTFAGAVSCPVDGDITEVMRDVEKAAKGS